MKLLVAMPPTETYSPATGGAIATVVEALARHWITDGHQVTVLSQPTDCPYDTGVVLPLTYRWPEPQLLRRAVLGAVRRARQYDWPAYPAYVGDIRRAVRMVQPDWLLVHNEAVIPALVRRPAGMRVAVTLHNTVHARRPLRVRRSLLRSDVLTAVSGFIAEEATAAFDLPLGSVAVVYNGVENRLYSRRATARPDGPLRVAYIGRMLFNKGPQVLLDAAESLAARGIPLRLTVAGSPTFERRSQHALDPFVVEVRARVSALGGTYSEHLDRQQVSDLLARQDVTVVPSLFDDPFPLAVFEGMASGCAVLTSDKGGLPEAAGDVATVLPAGDASALAQALERLHLDRDRLLEDKRRSLARAAANDWKDVARRWSRLLDDSI